MTQLTTKACAVALGGAVTLAGCGTGMRAAPHAVGGSGAQIERIARTAIVSLAPTARSVMKDCRDGRVGCAATDQEYWLSDRSGHPTFLVFRRSQIDEGDRVYVYAPRTNGKQFFFVVRIAPTRVLTAQLAEHGPIVFSEQPG
jgi:hypothetical protein